MTPLLPLDLSRLPVRDFDFLIVGSGVAGLSCALELSEHGTVAVLTKEDIKNGSTQWAQGGIAAVLSPEPLDSPALHQADTEFAGAGLSDPSAVSVLVSEGPKRIRELIARGAHFDTEPSGELKLTREAAHRARRIVHAQGDSTGREVQRSLSELAFEDPQIEVLENHLTVDFWISDERCFGAVALDANGEAVLFRAKATIAATGGIGALYKVTTNPPVLTGDGMGMAFRAGAQLMDMEFVQFHPTAFALGPSNPRFLISEAVRGEGALLVNSKGEQFMARYHELKELAPRDVVARAIASEILDSDTDHVFLDLTHNSAQEIAARFPTIYSTCVAYGVDPSKDLIPVAPAEHYMMGGIRTDMDGATNVPGLLACGECACTGVHGANRLASNSMLEGLVFGIRTVSAAIRCLESNLELPTPPHSKQPEQIGADFDLETLQAARTQLQSAMWKGVGLVRDDAGLRKTLRVLNDLYARFGHPAVKREAIELANMIECAWLVTRAALERKESRGAQFRRDYPELNDAWKHHLVLGGDRDDLVITPVEVK
ncbi:L-aspartate oxidase [bacterium]|nr:MAG: L-aspartate oxidase [bacterium]